MRLLVLLVVVDLVVPEEGLSLSQHRIASRVPHIRKAYLVTVSPEVVLGTQVLVCVLGLVLLGSVVGNMLPMGVPPNLGVDGGNDQARNGDARNIISTPSPLKMSMFPVAHPFLPLRDANGSGNRTPSSPPMQMCTAIPEKTH
jgi:hypothetical protein